MTLEDLIKIEESLNECEVGIETFNWGPAYYHAQQRREEALKILHREIRIAKQTESQK